MKKTLLAVVCAGLVLLVQSVATASIPFIDTFDTENGGVGQLNYFGFTNWNVTNGSVDLIGAGTSWDFFPGNGLYVDLDGSTGDAGLMTTKNTITLAPGLYQLSFYLGGNHRNYPADTVIVQSNIGSYSKNFVIASGDPLIQFTETLYIASPINANLSFENLGGDNVGAILDNVQLAAIPEPASLSLLGLGLLGLFGIKRKRKKL